jgi:hypothetical protein
MLFYMQMRNWFLVFIVLTMTYLVYQKSQQQNQRFTYRASLASFSIFR